MRPAKGISDFKVGTVIRHKHGAQALIVTGNYGDRATAVRTVDISNPSEWLVEDEAPRK